MKITPIDITNKEFKRTMRGYSSEEVDEFLDDIVEDFEALYRENSNLKEKIENFNDKMNHYTEIEKTLQSTLILAQSTADATKAQAAVESQNILNVAHEKAKLIVREANASVEDLKRDYEKYRMEFMNYRKRVSQFMENQMESFSSMSKDLEPVKKVPVLKVAPAPEPILEEQDDDLDEDMIEVEAVKG